MLCGIYREWENQEIKWSFDKARFGKGQLNLKTGSTLGSQVLTLDPINQPLRESVLENFKDIVRVIISFFTSPIERNAIKKVWKGCGVPERSGDPEWEDEIEGRSQAW